MGMNKGAAIKAELLEEHSETLKSNDVLLEFQTREGNNNKFKSQ